MLMRFATTHRSTRLIIEHIMRARIGFAAALLAGIVLPVAACGDKDTPAAATQAESASAPQAADAADDKLPPSQLETQLPPEVRDFVLKPLTGDLDVIIKRRLVRIGVTFNRTFYFLDKGVQRGVTYEYGQLVEERLNKHLKTGADNKVHVVFMPLPRHLLLPALVDGKVDLVAAQIMMRPELQKFVDFTNPTRMNVSEILVTGPGHPPLAAEADLSGRDVFVREKSSYRESLVALNERLQAQGKPAAHIRLAPENLEDDDLLEMVNAGLIPAIVVDDYLANFWKKIFPNITLHESIALRTGGTLAIAIRKNSPQLSQALNKFMGNYGLGTTFGNIVERKYLVNTTYAKGAASEAERKKFMRVVQLFRKYSDQYNLDYLLMAAQAYQESQLNHNARSAVGAVGIMQVMPSTGKELNVGDIRQLEPNIHAGVKYMRVTADTFFKNEPMDSLNKALFTFAAYNAGPGRVRQLRREATKVGLNPNLWFGNVEVIAAERIGRETVTYVANIYKYYVAYRLIVDEMERRTAAKAAVPVTKRK
jgi:membrane-bound lytic murein transglycosylase MltF